MCTHYTAMVTISSALVSSTRVMLTVVLLLLHICMISSSCLPHYCNGHGKCNNDGVCDCYAGYGAANDITRYRAPDCSAITCPSGYAFSDIPSDTDTAHSLVECSNNGLCNRATGKCTCYSNFRGDACESRKCINDCSGHGRCASMSHLGMLTDALPLGDNYQYSRFADGDTNAGTSAWDGGIVYGCVCDSSWSVGLGSGETQEPEWFGPDCSLRHCPSGDDPMTTSVETDCYGISAATTNSNLQATGQTGNLCHVECSNRGICNHSSGLCACFKGYYGVNCGLASALASDQAKGYLENNYITSDGRSIASVNSNANLI